LTIDALLNERRKSIQTQVYGFRVGDVVVLGETGSTAIGGFLPDDSTFVSLVIVVVPSGPVIFVFSWTPDCSAQPATPRTRAAHRERVNALRVRMRLILRRTLFRRSSSDYPRSNSRCRTSGVYRTQGSNLHAMGRISPPFPGETTRGIDLAMANSWRMLAFH